MPKHTSRSTARNLQLLALGAVAVASSFALGIQSASEVQPISLIEAGAIERAGDMDGDGIVDVQDAIAILEIAEGYRTASPAQLRADPNGDGVLSVDDAIRILTALQLR
jgi:hypothetical protein